MEKNYFEDIECEGFDAGTEGREPSENPFVDNSEESRRWETGRKKGYEMFLEIEARDFYDRESYYSDSPDEEEDEE